MRIRAKLFMFVAPSMLVLVLLGVITIRSFQGMAEANDTLHQHHQLFDAWVRLSAAIQSPIDAFDRYLLTANPTEAERFETLAAEAEASFQVVGDLIGGDPEAGSSLDQAHEAWLEVRAQVEGLLGQPAGSGQEWPEGVSEGIDARVVTLGLQIETLAQDQLAQFHVSHDESSQAFQRAPWIILAVVLVGIVVLVVATWVFSSAYIRPIVALTQVAGSLGRGEFGTRASVKGKDETSILGRTLNEMADALHQLWEKRQGLSRATQGAIVGVDQRVALKRILEIGLDVLDCERGAVFVPVFENNHFICSSHVGLSDELASSVAQSFPHFPGVSGLLDQKPAVVLDAQETPLLAPSVEAVRKEGFRSCAVFPLILEKETVGALVVCRDQVRGFDRNEMRLAEILSDQAARVIDRERMLYTQRQAEARHHALFDRVPVGLYRATAQGEILEANPAIVQMLKYPDVESIRKRNAIEFYVDPEDRKRMMAILEGEGSVLDFETQFWRHDGERIWIRNSAKVVKDEHGEVLYFDGMLEDMTSRKLAEQAIRLGEERLRSVLQSTRDAIISVDEQGTVIFWNLGAEIAFGHSAHEIVGTPLERVIADSSLKRYRELIESTISSDNGDFQELPLEIVGLKKGGASFPAELMLSKWEAEGHIFLTGILRDITSRKQAEGEIRKLSRAIEQSANMVIITNSEGKIEYVNPKFTSITGYSPGDVVGKGPSILKSGETAEEEYQHLQETVSSGEEWRGVFRNRKKNGELFWASASISPVTDEQGRITHILAVEEDITERKKAEAQIQQQLDRLGALRAIDMAISASLDPQITFNILLQHVIKQLGVDAANILMFNKQTQLLEYACGVGFRTDALRHTRLRIGKGHAGKAALERRMVAIPDLASDLGEFIRAPQLIEEEFVSYFAVPLCAKGQVKGVLETFHRSPLNPDEEWIHFLEALAAQGAIALENASLLEDLQRSNEELVVALDTMLEGWGKSLEFRDVEKAGHTERVAMNTVRLAREIGIRDVELVHIRRGAILHDIGEIGV
ncbi:MAG: PAS domain S-box protein, partial [Anaerolineales bacterium]